MTPAHRPSRCSASSATAPRTSGTPRCAPWPRTADAEGLPYFRKGLQSGCHCPQGGFTLLELIVVLFLAGLLAALVVPSFSGTLEATRLRSGAAEVRSVLTLARALAVSGSQARTVAFEPGKGEYGIEGDARRYFLPGGVRIESARLGGVTREQEPFRVRFFADGSADEASILVSSTAGGRLRIAVDPLTGIAEAET